MVTKNQRLEFAAFLDRLAIHKTSESDWRRFVVCHYTDTFLEEIRRSIVRLYADELEIHSRTDAAAVLVESWATLVRASVGSTKDDDVDEVTFTLTESEAVVLDNFLRRFSESDVLEIKHPAEQCALWNLQCVFEKVGNPNWKPIQEALVDLSPADE